MPKSKSKEIATEAQPLQNGSNGFDSSLAALFASSAGPVTAPKKISRSSVIPKSIERGSHAPKKMEQAVADVPENEDSDSEIDSDQEEDPSAGLERPRKRRKVDANEDLESRYLDKLAREEEIEQEQQQKSKTTEAQELEDSDSDLNSGLEDLSDSDDDQVKVSIDKDTEDAIPKHESLGGKYEIETKKLSRTVFLGNVSISVIKSKSAKKALILHLRSGIDEKHHEKVESIRFRSTAFVSDAGPKRAAYAKKELKEETMRSTNAYVVMSSDAAARKVAARLNGTIVLDRHLRVDNLGNPARIDHRRCVFVGNLSFVDEATATDETEDGSAKRKRAKEPADVEEGLWRTFGKCGKVESVRVVRDKETRISKGFAYVQFMDENAVEAALLLNEKKFPPMLPRVLRVSRAKKNMKSKRKDQNGGDRPRTREQRTPGQKAPFANARNTTNKPIFEGHRATNKSMPKGLKKLKKRPATRPTDRGSKRAAAFRAGGGKKKRDMGS